MRFSKYEFYNKLLGGVTLLLYIYTRCLNFYIYLFTIIHKRKHKRLKTSFQRKDMLCM